MIDQNSFGYKLKSELSEPTRQSTLQKKALLYGLVLFSRGFFQNTLLTQTEYECVATRLKALLMELCGIDATLSSLGGGNPLFLLSTATVEDKHKLLAYLSHSVHEISVKVNMANLESDDEICAFIRGAFLACGYVSDPGKTYRIEFVAPRYTLSKNLAYILSQAGFEAKITQRKGSYVLYFRESAVIEDLITYMGATLSTLELMDVKVLKDLRNNINRKTNCETANIEKTVTASTQQIKNIRALKRSGMYDLLSDELKEIASLRLKYPESSLSELGEMASPPLTRSGVSHRLRKINEIAAQIKVKKTKRTVSEK